MMGLMTTDTAGVRRMAEQRITGLSWGNKASATAYYGGEVDEVATEDNLRRAGEGFEAMSMFNNGG